MSRKKTVEPTTVATQPLFSTETARGVLEQLPEEVREDMRVMGDAYQPQGLEPRSIQPMPPSIMDLMNQAIAKGDTDTMARLFDMRREMRAEAAEEAFSASMTKAQSEMRRVNANSTNPQTHSDYASYDQLDRALRPIYTKNGFALNFNSDENTPPGYVHVFCDVSHSGGCMRRYWCPLMPADGKGAKGGDVMTLTHAAASGISYSMRYLLKMIFNVAVGEDDDDGNEGADAETFVGLTQGQLLDLNAKIEEVGANRALFLKYFKIEKLEDFPAKRFSEALRALEEKARKGQE